MVLRPLLQSLQKKNLLVNYFWKKRPLLSRLYCSWKGTHSTFKSLCWVKIKQMNIEAFLIRCYNPVNPDENSKLLYISFKINHISECIYLFIIQSYLVQFLLFAGRMSNLYSQHGTPRFASHCKITKERHQSSSMGGLQGNSWSMGSCWFH